MIQYCTTSQPLEDQVLIGLEQAVAPEEQPAGNGDLLHPGDYELGDLLEIAFAGLHFPRIDIISFEMGEIELDWGCIVAVRPGEQDRELELLIQF